MLDVLPAFLMRVDVLGSGVCERDGSLHLLGQLGTQALCVGYWIDTACQLEASFACQVSRLGEGDRGIGPQTQVPAAAAYLVAQQPATRSVHGDVQHQAAHASDVCRSPPPDVGHLLGS